MSVYNQNILTRIIDPVFDRSNFRSEYRLNANSLYLSNFRLIGMGIKTSSTPNAYNPLLGAFCMNSIQLFDGNKLLDQILSADIWQAFKNFNNSNDENNSINGNTSRSSYGFEVSTVPSTGQVPYQTWDKGGTNLPLVEDIKIASSLFDEYQNSTTNADPESASWLALKGLLPILTSSLYLPGGVFKNLRLVINWKNNTELKAISVNPAENFETFTETALIVDEIVDDNTKMMVTKDYKGVVFNAVEHDQVVVNATVPAAGATSGQASRFLVNGFNNKTLEKLVVVQTPTNPATYTDTGFQVGAGIVGSFAQLDSTFQFRVNGQNKLPRSGYTKKNQRLAALVDSYGEVSLPTSCNFVYVPKARANLVPFADDGFTMSLQGQLDWTAIEIREPVKELIVEYNRVGVHGNDILNQALRLNLFGEVTKAISVNKDMSYVISYL